MSAASTYLAVGKTPQVSLQADLQSEPYVSGAGCGRRRATSRGRRGLEISATRTPREYQEKYARLPRTFGSWTPDSNEVAAGSTGPNRAIRRGLRGLEML